MLALSGVSAGYGSVPAVHGVDIVVGKGEAVGLLGANGAGKSTTLRAISGLVRLTSGRITFLEKDIAAHNLTGSQISILNALAHIIFVDRLPKVLVVICRDLRITLHFSRLLRDFKLTRCGSEADLHSIGVACQDY